MLLLGSLDLAALAVTANAHTFKPEVLLQLKDTSPPNLPFPI